MKLTAIIGNGNTGWALHAAIYSLMKHNGELIEKIVIIDNISTELKSLEFYNENKYKNMTEIIHYDSLQDRDPMSKWPISEQYDIGLYRCDTDFAILLHSDMVYRANIVEHFLNVILPENPDVFIYGNGGGDHKNIKSRINEWSMIINVKKYILLGATFRGRTLDGKSYDTGCFLYKRAMENGMKIVTMGEHPDDTKWYRHFVMGSHERKEIAENMAKEWLKDNE